MASVSRVHKLFIEGDFYLKLKAKVAKSVKFFLTLFPKSKQRKLTSSNPQRSSCETSTYDDFFTTNINNKSESAEIILDDTVSVIPIDIKKETKEKDLESGLVVLKQIDNLEEFYLGFLEYLEH